MTFGRIHLLAGLAALLSAGGLSAQENLPFGFERGSGPLPRSVELEAGLQAVEQAVQRQDGERAVTILQSILDVPEDAWTGPPAPVSLRERAESLWLTLPPETQRLYERRFSAQAAALLEQATATGDWRGWIEAARRFVFTPAGRQAAWRLALLRHDQGHVLGAALDYERLLRIPAAAGEFGPELRLRAAAAWWLAGEPQPARDHLAALTAEHQGSITIGGQALTLPTAEQSVDEWFAAITGAAPRSAAPPLPSAAAEPLADSLSSRLRFLPFLQPVAWNAPPLDGEDVPQPQRVAQLTTQLLELDGRLRSPDGGGRVLIPAAAPLVLGDRVIVRGPDKLRALALTDGALDWPSAAVDATFKELVFKSDFPDREQLVRDLFLGQRSWRDRTSAQMSTDGVRVYAVMNCGMLGAFDPAMSMLFGASRSAKGPLKENSLQAYQVRGGKLHWSIGSPRGPQEDEFSGLFFLGPPVPADGLLYCLVEDRGQVRLLALDPAPSPRPTLLWSQALLNVPSELSIEHHEARRTAAFSPVALGNVLLCPTGAGYVAAFDVQRRQLLWAARYHTPPERDPREILLRNAMRQRQNLVTVQRQALDRLLDSPHWRGGSQVFVDGPYVILTAPENHGLVCLRAATGEVVWQRPAERWLYLAAVHDGRLILVGEAQVEALRIADGTPAWPAPLPLPSPSGLGVQHGRLYSLPLSTGELATIDLAAGRLLVRSPLGEGAIPGNLAIARGRLIDQSAIGIRSSRSIETTERELAAAWEVRPDDTAALALRGELRLHAGDVSGGRGDLRRAVQAGGEARTRRVLASSLLDELRIDFAAGRDLIPEIDPLVTGTPDEARFRRLLALGWQALGERTAAFEQYLRLGALTPAEEELENLDPELAVEVERWIEAQIRDLLSQATAAERTAMLEILRDRLRSAVAQPPSDVTGQTLASLLRLARGTELEAEAVLAAARGSSTLHELWQEWLWLKVEASPAPEQQAEAVARLAELYLQVKNSAALAPRLARLKHEFRDRVCRDGQTGAELTAAWEADPRHAFTLAAAEVETWPAGPLTVTRGEGDLPALGRLVPVVGRVEGPLRGWSFRFDDRQQRLSAYTPHGRFGWEVSLGPGSQGDQSIPRSVMIRGHLVMVVFEERFWLVNALDATAVRFRQTHWGQRLIDDSAATIPFQGLGRQLRPRGQFGLAGPLGAEALVFQKGDLLTAIDPWTTRVLWRRTHATGVAEILADDSYVVVRPYSLSDTLVLRAADGTVAARHRFPDELTSPPADTDWGRLMLSIRPIAPEGNAPESAADLPPGPTAVSLGMYDPLTGQFAWQRTVRAPVWRGTIDGDTLALVDASGTFQLIEPETGRVLWEQRLQLSPSDPLPPPVQNGPPAGDAAAAPVEEPQSEPAVAAAVAGDSLTVFSDEHRVFVVLNQPQDPKVVQFDRQQTAERPVNGMLHAFDRASGRLLWRREVAGQYVNPQLPSGWPFLVLSAVQSRPEAESSEHRLLILDRASGEVLHESAEPVLGSPASRFNRQTAWTVDPEQPIARLWFGRTLVLVRSGAEPPTP